MELGERIKTALRKIGEYYIAELKNRLAADGKDVTGDLRKSLTSEVVEDGVIITANRYLMAISGGKKATSKGPSRTMVHRVERWMKAKGLTPRKGGMTPLAYRRASFGIAKAINRRGWKGSGVIQKSFRAIESSIDEELTKAIKTHFEDKIKEINVSLKQSK